MTRQLNHLAIDLGASGGKVNLGCFDGNKISIQKIYSFSNSPIVLRNHIHWDVLRLLEEIIKGISLANKMLDGQIDSIGLDTWGTDFCLLDRDGNLVENPHCYRDMRSEGMMEKVFEKIPRQEIYNLTGVQFMQFNTIYQLYSMVANDAPLLQVASTFLMIPDMFNFWLSGERMVEYTNATTTQFFDPFNKDWCWPILEVLSFPKSLFPPTVQPGTRLGNLQSWLCEELNLQPIPVIAVATHDTASAASVVPAQDEDYAFLSSGTWSLLGAELNQPIISEIGLQNNFSSYGGVCNTFLLWKNIQALWLLQECQRTWQEAGYNFSHEDLISAAKEAQPFGSIIDTDDVIFLTPGDFPSRIAKFCKQTGQNPPTDIGATVRCILESLALRYYYNFEKLKEVLGRDLGKVFVISGGARNQLLNQLIAEVLEVPIYAGLTEATSVGNIMMQLKALGHVETLTQIRQVVGTSFETALFEGRRGSGWEEAIERFIKITDSSKQFNP